MIFVQNSSPITPIRSQQATDAQHYQPTEQPNTMTVSTPEDGNVLKKVISFTIEQMNNGEHATSNKSTRPTFVPEKLNFSAYEQFEGEFYSFRITFVFFLFLFAFLFCLTVGYSDAITYRAISIFITVVGIALLLRS